MALNFQASSSLGSPQVFSWGQVASSNGSVVSRVGLNSQASGSSGSLAVAFAEEHWIERLDERLDTSLEAPCSKKEC